MWPPVSIPIVRLPLHRRMSKSVSALAASEQIDLRLRISKNREARTSKQRFGRRLVGYEPVCRIAGITVLDEKELRIVGPVENSAHKPSLTAGFRREACCRHSAAIKPNGPPIVPDELHHEQPSRGTISLRYAEARLTKRRCWNFHVLERFDI